MSGSLYRVVTLALVECALCMSLACRRGDAITVTDPLMDVFQGQAKEEGLTRVQTTGRRVFAHYCATCHGDTGQGDGQNAFTLDPKPPNFQESLKARPSSYSRQVIEGGTAAVGRSPLCPPRGRTLSDRDVDALVAYLEVLAQKKP